jgi:hypothetical protein
MADSQPKPTTAKRPAGRANGAGPKSGTKTTGARSAAAASRSGTSASRSSSAAKKRASQTRSSSNSGSRSARSGGQRSAARRTTPKTAKSRSSNAKSRAATPATSNGRGSSSGLAGTIKDVASKAKGPAVAVGAAAAGIAGGLVIRSRTRRRTILGLPVPKHVPTVDPQAIVKSVGNASKQFAKTSKTVSKDIERAGDQAERIGKILS